MLRGGTWKSEHTAYGSGASALTTGVDAAQDASGSSYNAFQYNSHRYTAGTGTYDMGFRDYDPGLNRFLTRDMYGGALADMGLATDPYTGNRYSFAGGNPISFIELDGHLFGMSGSDWGHLALDVVGLVPVVGEVADVANGIWYAAEGNYVDAALSMASAIPFAGTAVGAAKLAKTGYKVADNAIDGAKAADAAATAARTTRRTTSSGGSGGAGSGGAASKADGGSAPSCKTNSFLPGTRVLMGDGSTKQIEDITEGDEVRATDPATGATRARVVTDTRDHKSLRTLITITVAGGEVMTAESGNGGDGFNGATLARADDGGDGGGKITATDEHPFWVPDLGRWVPAGELEAGMFLRTSAGTWVQITAIDADRATERVYNLSVDGVHTYYVVAGGNSLLTHNCGGSNVGGTHGSLRPANQPGFSTPQEINHMPQHASTPLSYGQGPAIRMDRSDHRQVWSTGTGSRPEPKAWKMMQTDLVNSGRIDQAMQNDINDVVTRFPGKYNNAIGDMIGALSGNAGYQAARRIPQSVYVQLTLW